VGQASGLPVPGVSDAALDFLLVASDNQQRDGRENAPGSQKTSAFASGHGLQRSLALSGRFTQGRLFASGS
jgi:hypothetical protein